MAALLPQRLEVLISGGEVHSEALLLKGAIHEFCDARVITCEEDGRSGRRTIVRVNLLNVHGVLAL